MIIHIGFKKRKHCCLARFGDFLIVFISRNTCIFSFLFLVFIQFNLNLQFNSQTAETNVIIRL